MKKATKGLFLFLFLLVFFTGCSQPVMEMTEKENSETSREETFTGYMYLYGEMREMTFTSMDGVTLIEGDIAVPDSEIFSSPEASLPISRAVIRTDNRWTNGTVHFVIAPNVYNSQIIRDAISQISSQTNVTFINGTAANYIEIIPSSGSWSYVGMIGGKQQLGLADWATKGTVIHELCHAIGLEHEQCRADRDNYLNILTQNITSGNEYNFNKYADGNHEDIGSFDFNSIMLYGSYAFSSNGQPTITRKDGSTFNTNGSYLSYGDLAGIAARVPAPNLPVSLYQHGNYGGWQVAVNPGSYTLTGLAEKGFVNDDMTSFRVWSGYRAILYSDDNFGGAAYVITGEGNLPGDWNDKVSSLVVEQISPDLTVHIEAEDWAYVNGVQTEACKEGGLNIGWIDAGDWVAYTGVNIPQSGTYRVEYRVASLNVGGNIRLEQNSGTTLLGSITVPVTNDWQNWTTISHTVNLNAGPQDFGLAFPAGGFNLNWIKFSKL